MTDKPKDPTDADTATELSDLESADPADAPQIAEDLADRLAQELDGTSGPRTSNPEGTS